MNKSNRNNFTLLELLILITVLLVLAGMVLPALDSTHGYSRIQAECASNLSQIGKAFFQYAMSWDDWFPTTMSGLPENVGKWTGDAKSLDLLRSQDLLTDPKGYICLSVATTEPAENNKPLSVKNVGYAWNEGLMGSVATMSGICSDGLTNHKKSGRFVRGDGSVANAAGYKWFKEMKTKEDMNITFQ